jgi:hypothetical protein
MIKYIIFGMVFVKLNLSYALFYIFLRILIFENENENETKLRMEGKRVTSATRPHSVPKAFGTLP